LFSVDISNWLETRNWAVTSRSDYTSSDRMEKLHSKLYLKLKCLKQVRWPWRFIYQTFKRHIISLT